MKKVEPKKASPPRVKRQPKALLPSVTKAKVMLRGQKRRYPSLLAEANPIVLQNGRLLSYNIKGGPKMYFKVRYSYDNPNDTHTDMFHYALTIRASNGAALKVIDRRAALTKFDSVLTTAVAEYANQVRIWKINSRS